MNIQAMMKQAQQMQKDMLKAKEEIDKTIFNGESALVHVEVNGKKELVSVKIDDSFEADDIEILQDMIVVAVNDAITKVNKMTEEKMGKFGSGLSGLM